MNKNNTKKRIIILTAAVILLGALGITAAVGVYKLIMGTDTGSDRYLEQMLKGAETGDRRAIASLYLPRNVSEYDMEREIQELLEVWDTAQPYTYKKTGYQMNSTSRNGAKVKVFTSVYTITTESGEKVKATLQREERGSKSGVTSFTIASDEDWGPVGRLDTMDRWTAVQWLFFAFSLVIIGSTVATAVDCYRRNPRYRWGWIALILFVYISPGLTLFLENGRRVLRLHSSLTLMGLSKYVSYPFGDIIIRLYLPVGMVIYWILRKGMTPSVKGESQL